MAGEKYDPPGRGAGWVVAAIVAVIAICAVSFMVTQRPQQAIAVAQGDAVTSKMQHGQPPTRPTRPATESVSPDGADTGRTAPEPSNPPRTAMDANAAGSNASALEPAH